MIKNEETKAFFEFLISNEASTGYTDKLKIYVTDAKQSTENKRQYMEWERQRAYDLEAGIEKGQQLKAVEDARKLLADGKYTAEEISNLLQIPVESFSEVVQVK